MDEQQVDSITTAQEFYKKKSLLQKKLKVPKTKFNSFKNYYYYSLGDIFEQLNPLLHEMEASLQFMDELYTEPFYYIKSTVIFSNGNFSLKAVGFAGIDMEKKDLAQAMGGAATYARKYAVKALFCIDDDSEDIERDNPKNKERSNTKIDLPKKIKPSTLQSQIDSLTTIEALDNFHPQFIDKVTDKFIFNELCKKRAKDIRQDKGRGHSATTPASTTQQQLEIH